MRDLAESLGISVSTVSLALRNDPRIAVKTRHRVQQAARKVGYRLNPTLTHLMSNVRQAKRAHYRETLAFLNPEVSPRHFSEVGVEYQRHIWKGAFDRAESLGYALANFWLAEPGMSGRRMSAILKARGIRGLLVPPLPRECGHLSIKWEEFSAVALTYTMARPQLHRVVPDHHNAMQLMTRTLARRGYRRPGLLLLRGYDQRADHRCSAAFYFHQQSLPVRDRIPVKFCSRKDHQAESTRWLKRYRPDVVITMGVLRHLRHLDVGDPEYSENLGIILLGYAETDAGFTAIHENPGQIGAIGIDQLVGALNRNERGVPTCPQTLLVPGSWMEGTTLPVLP